MVVLFCTLSASLQAANADYEIVSRTLITSEESCPNGAIDPGETNTVTFVIKKISDGAHDEVEVRLLPNSGNVDFVVSTDSPRQRIEKNGQYTATIRFRSKGACGDFLVPSLVVSRKSGDNSRTDVGDPLVLNTADSKGRFQLGANVNRDYSFSNNSAITIRDFHPDHSGKASTYPSSLSVSGVPNGTGNTGEKVSKVVVTLKNLTHGYVRDVNALLVSPSGKKLVLMAEAGGATTTDQGVTDVTLTFDGTASSQLPRNAQITSGTYKPSDFGSGSFPAPAPAAPYSDNLESSFDETDVNGTWQLFIVDDQLGDSGQLATGWSLSFTTTQVVCCGAGETFPAIAKDNVPSISKVTINEDTKFASDEPSSNPPSPAVSFRVADLETAGDNLTVTATSSNQALIKDSNLKLTKTGSGSESAANGNRKFADYTIEFKPEANQFGNANITLTVTDGSGRSGTLVFQLQVDSVNDLPTFPVTIRNQSVNIGAQTSELSFSVADVETAAGDIIVTGVSSDTTKVPNENIIFSGLGANRTVRIIPATTGQNGTSGQVTITLTAKDANNQTSQMPFTVAFNTQAGDPTITPTASFSMDEDTSKTLTFEVRSNTSTPVNNLVLSRSTSNANLLPTGNIVFGGTGTERTVTFTPLANQSGTATVKLIVTDPQNGQDSETEFVVTVNSVNDTPTISSLSAQTINEDSEGGTGELPFTISDVETAGENLTVSATSSNTELVPLANITFPDNEGGTRTVKVVPAANEYGRATITVTVSDSNKQASTSFLLTVNAVNDAPIIAQVDGDNLANNSNDAPTVATLIEDANNTFVDGDANKGVVEQFISMTGIAAGAGDETEQTVTITATVDKPEIISALRVVNDNGDTANTVKDPTTSRRLGIKLVRNAFGTVTVTLNLTDNGVGGVGTPLTTVRKFKIDVTAVNDPISLAAIPVQTTPKGTGIRVPIDISDVETSDSQVVMTKSSSDTTKVKNENILFDAANSSVNIVPEAGQTGTVEITVTATDRGALNDGNGTTAASRTFTLTLADVAVNTPPEITSLTPATSTIEEDSFASAQIVVADPGGNVDTVTLSGVSSDTSLVPQTSILFGGTGANRTLAISPAGNKNGVATITVTATDAGGFSSASKTFTVTVLGVEDNPTIAIRRSGDDGTKWTDESNDADFPGRDTLTVNEDANPVEDPKTGSKRIELEVSDAETGSDNLTVTAESTNTGLVPNGNIQISSSGSVRTVTITPAANQNGTSTITFKVKDAGNREATAKMILKVNSINDQPTIASLPNMTVNEDSAQQTISLTGITAGGGESQTLTVTAFAADKGSNPAANTLLVPKTNTARELEVNYTSANETGILRFTPVANKFGTSVITVTVTDNGATGGDNRNTRDLTFEVTVSEVNDVPTISSIADTTVSQDGATPVIAFTVEDSSGAQGETPAEQLAVTFQSSNTTLVPVANITATGSGANRGLIVTPAKGQSGTADITVTVADKGKVDGSDVKTASRTFKVTVVPGALPTISPIADMTLQKNEFSSVVDLTVTDAQTAPENLRITWSSSDTSIIPNSNIQIGGTGTQRQLVVLAGSTPGSANVTVTVTDSDNQVATRVFRVTVLGNNPTISAIADQVVTVGNGTGALPFTVGDAETFASLLTLEKASSNTSFVPLNGIVFGGSGANRTVTVTPATGQTGSSRITIVVRDTNGQTNSTSFLVGTPDTNSAPTITAISNVSIAKGSSTGVITFTVGDSETAAGSLNVTATSSNQALVPNGSILLGGSGSANRSLLITPVADQEGTATITVTVTDGGGKTAQTTFTLTVRSSSAPTISSVSNQTTDRNVAVTVTVTVGDSETAAGQLTVSGASSNQTLIPNANVVVSGTGANRTVTITPANGQVGTATITLTVTDGDNRTATTTFTVTVNQTGSTKGDINGDGKSDIVFQDGDGFLAVWTANGEQVTGANYLSPSNIGDLSYRIAGSGDFNRDGKEDLLFESTSGSLAVWYMDGGTQVDAAVLNPSSTGDTNWKVVGVGDFNRDGKADIALQHADGTLGVWFMDGVNLTSAALIEPSNPGDAAWKIAGVGDLNGDGRQDLVFQHIDGTLAVWNLNGANGVTVSTASLLNPSFAGDAAWRVVGVCDRNGDGKADLLFQHSDSSIAIWYMNGANVTSAKMLNPSMPGVNWKVVAPR